MQRSSETKYCLIAIQPRLIDFKLNLLNQDPPTLDSKKLIEVLTKGDVILYSQDRADSKEAFTVHNWQQKDSFNTEDALHEKFGKAGEYRGIVNLIIRYTENEDNSFNLIGYSCPEMGVTKGVGKEVYEVTFDPSIKISLDGFDKQHEITLIEQKRRGEEVSRERKAKKIAIAKLENERHGGKSIHAKAVLEEARLEKLEQARHQRSARNPEQNKPSATPSIQTRHSRKPPAFTAQQSGSASTLWGLVSSFFQPTDTSSSNNDNKKADDKTTTNKKI